MRNLSRLTGNLHGIPREKCQVPQRAALDGGDASTNLCMSCHQGRQSTVSVNAAVSGKDDDTVSDGLSFLNVHYSQPERHALEPKRGGRTNMTDRLTTAIRACTWLRHLHRLPCGSYP